MFFLESVFLFLKALIVSGLRHLESLPFVFSRAFALFSFSR